MIQSRNINQRKAGVVLSYLSMGIEYIVAFLYTPALIALLGQSGYGNYNYIMSVTNYLLVLSSGFGTAYVRFYARFKSDSAKGEQDIRKLNGMFLTIFLIIGALASVIGFGVSFYADTLFGGQLSASELAAAPILVRILTVNVFVTFINIVFKSFVIAQEKFIFQKLLLLLQFLLRPLVILPVLYFNRTSVAVAVGTLIVTTVIMLIDGYYCVVHGKMRFSFKGFDFSLFKEIASFSSFLLIFLVTERLNWSIDKMILGKIVGTIAVAIYSVASELNHVYKQLSTNMTSVFVAKINKMIASESSDEQVSALFIRIGRIMFLILTLICSGFVFFGKAFINLWVGPDYKEAYWIVLLLMIPATIPEIQKIGPEVLKAKNLHKFRSIAYLVIAIANVCISIPLGKLFGGIGCALGTAITVLLGHGVIMNIYYYRIVKLNVIRFWKQILSLSKGLIIPMIIGVIIANLITVNSWISLLLCCCMYAAVYAVSMWLFAMNSYEKQLITNFIKKIH